MYGMSNMETYITICKIDSQGEFAVWLRKLKQELCINLDFEANYFLWVSQEGKLCTAGALGLCFVAPCLYVWWACGSRRGRLRPGWGTLSVGGGFRGQKNPSRRRL